MYWVPVFWVQNSKICVRRKQRLWILGGILGYLGNLRKGNLVCTDPAIDPGKYSQIIECHIESSTLSLNVFRNHQLACWPFDDRTLNCNLGPHRGCSHLVIPWLSRSRVLLDFLLDARVSQDVFKKQRQPVRTRLKFAFGKQNHHFFQT